MDVNVTIRIDRIDDLIKAAGMLAGLHAGEAAPAGEQKPYSAQIAQATQIPAQASPAAPIAQPAQTAPAPQQQAQAPGAQPAPAPIAQPSQAAPPAVPTAERGYTLDELAGAAMTLMDKGMQAQLQELLAGYGVEALPMLPQEQYGSFATALRGMGAQI